MNTFSQYPDLQKQLPTEPGGKRLLLLHLIQEGSGSSQLSAAVVEASLRGIEEEVQYCEIPEGEVADFLARYRIPRIPMLLIFKDGELQARLGGLFPSRKLRELLPDLL